MEVYTGLTLELDLSNKLATKALATLQLQIGRLVMKVILLNYINVLLQDLIGVVGDNQFRLILIIGHSRNIHFVTGKSVYLEVWEVRQLLPGKFFGQVVVDLLPVQQVGNM